MAIDLNTCKPGDLLISQHNAVFRYRFKEENYYPHRVLYSNLSDGSRIDDGHVFNKNRLPSDHDIVGVFHLDGPVQNVLFGKEYHDILNTSATNGIICKDEPFVTQDSYKVQELLLAYRVDVLTFNLTKENVDEVFRICVWINIHNIWPISDIVFVDLDNVFSDGFSDYFDDVRCLFHQKMREDPTASSIYNLTKVRSLKKETV